MGQYKAISNPFKGKSDCVLSGFSGSSKCKKPHNIAETLIKPILVDCTGILLGENSGSKENEIFLSNGIVEYGITDMTSDIKS